MILRTSQCLGALLELTVAVAVLIKETILKPPPKIRPIPPVPTETRIEANTAATSMSDDLPAEKFTQQQEALRRNKMQWRFRHALRHTALEHIECMAMVMQEAAPDLPDGWLAMIRYQLKTGDPQGACQNAHIALGKATRLPTNQKIRDLQRLKILHQNIVRALPLSRPRALIQVAGSPAVRGDILI